MAACTSKQHKVSDRESVGLIYLDDIWGGDTSDYSTVESAKGKSSKLITPLSLFSPASP